MDNNKLIFKYLYKLSDDEKMLRFGRSLSYSRSEI